MIELQDTASIFAIVVSVLALILTIRQQRGPDIKFLSMLPAKFKIDRDRQKDPTGHLLSVQAHVAIDLVVVNEGAAAGTLMSCHVSSIQGPEPVSGVEWTLELVLSGSAAGPRNPPCPIEAGENFPAKLLILHTLPAQDFPNNAYDVALSQHEIWTRISYVRTKKRFLIGPTFFDSQTRDVFISKENICRALMS